MSIADKAKAMEIMFQTPTKTEKNKMVFAIAKGYPKLTASKAMIVARSLRYGVSYSDLKGTIPEDVLKCVEQCFSIPENNERVTDGT